jgi:hypothetical protein
VRAGKERSDAPASTQNNQLARASGLEESFEEASKTPPATRLLAQKRVYHYKSVKIKTDARAAA